jgi:hypothetical protein
MNTAPRTLIYSPDRRLFFGAAIAILVVVFAGFARSYFLKGLFGTPALPWLVQLHGAVMTSWFLLFFAQASLISNHRADLHRRLGGVGAVLAAVMVVLGMVVVLHAAAREVHAHTKDAPFFLMLLAVDPFILLVFAALVASAIAMRRRSDVHKRLMLLATLDLTAVAIGRLPFPNLALFWVAFGLWLFLPAAIDTVRNRRLHPVFGWGAPAILISSILVWILASTPAWQRIAQQFVS